MATTPKARAEVSRRDLYDAFHRGLLQKERLLQLVTPLGADVLVPLRAQGWAKIGRDYRWTVDVVSIRVDIPLLSLMHQPVTLRIQQTGSPSGMSAYRQIDGFVHRMSMLGTDGGLTAYQIEFSSALYFLGHTRNDRYWLDTNASDILYEVLSRYPQLQGCVRVRFLSRPRARSYCRQAESDLNFVHRLLEDEGWYYYWQQTEDKTDGSRKTTLVIVDRLCFLPEPKRVSYRRGKGDDDTAGLTQWAAVQTLQSTAYTVCSFDYRYPWDNSKTTSTLQSTSYAVRDSRSDETVHIPAVPMEVFESLSYGYPDWQAGNDRAHLRTQAWDAHASRYMGTGGWRWIDAGSRFVLDHHPRHDEHDTRQREFVAVELRWTIENNVPIGQPAAGLPHSLQRAVADVKAAHGTAFESLPHAVDGEVGYFVVQLEAQKTTVEYCSPFEHAKPAMHIEHAKVVAPRGEEAWSDELNRVYVRFAWDRQTPDDVCCSSPLLLSLQADTGSGYGAVHVPRAGEQVAIDHWGGDCDRPFVLGRINSGATTPPWHTNVMLSGFRSRGFDETGAFNELVHDDAANQGGTRLTSFTGKSYSAFHQGYLIRHAGNSRGAYLGNGFLLHTDDYGAMRANGGLYVSTHAKAHDGAQLDIDELHEQLDRAGTLVGALSNASALAQAESLQASEAVLKAVTSGTRREVSGPRLGGRTGGGGMGETNAFGAPLIVMASPAGIGLSTQQSVQVTADQQISLVSGESSYVATGKSFVVAAAEKLSMFVHKAGMKLLAAKGKVELTAQSDDMRLYADRNMTLTSNQGRVVIEASQELMLKCGGSYIRITPDGIEDGTRGARTVKAASLSKKGPGSVAEHMNAQKKANFNDPYVIRDRITGEVLNNHAYELMRDEGTRLTGTTNDGGHVPEQKSEDVETVGLLALRSGLNLGGTST